MRLHVELRARTLEGCNVAPGQATTRAAQKFGNRAGFKESVWDLWSFRTVENFWSDLMFGARVLRATPGFAIIAVLTLALGIGATAAMFSVIDNVLIEPFPYAHEQRLYSVVIRDLSSNQAGERSMLPADELLDYQQRNRVFEDVIGVAINRALWNVGAAPESVNAPFVTPNAFEFLGVPALLGRVATPADVQPGSPPVCVMSYAFWKSRFAGDRNVLGKTLILDGVPRTVIGVMPPRFVFWSADVWLLERLTHTGSVQPPWYYMLGRLKPGLDAATADRELQQLAERIAPSYRPNLYTNHFVVNLQRFVFASTEKVGRTLYMLLAAIGLLLLVACANVANLLLARVSSRKRELAIRTSLGAGWWRIVRQLFLESALLASLGAAVGWAFAWGGLKALVAVLPPNTFPDEAVIALNARVLLATAGVTVLTALFFGIVPLLGGLSQDVNDALKSGGYGQTGFRRAHARSLLIICEVAVSLVLLSAAGLTMRTFLREREVQLGIAPDHLLTAQVSLTKSQRSVDQQARFIRNLTTTLQGVPGVFDVATTTDFLPFTGAQTALTSSTNIHAGQAEDQFALVDPTFFRALEIPFLAGRNLTEADVAGKHMVAVINRALAKKFFPHQDPIGQRLQVNTLAYLPQPLANPWVEIVGIVSDFKNRGIRQWVIPEVFLPYTLSGLGGFALIMRTGGDPHSLSRTLESSALSMDGNAVVRRIRTLQDALEAEVYSRPRFGLRIFVVFCSLGVLLVSAGLYSVTAYAVLQRRREMGIRIALGATSADVQTLVISAEMRAVGVGILAGLGLSFLSTRLLAGQLWGISAHDPLTFAAVIGILIMVGLAASYIPSLAAMRVDPVETLRAE
jgi:putative ABC transport system permease protein